MDENMFSEVGEECTLIMHNDIFRTDVGSQKRQRSQIQEMAYSQRIMPIIKISTCVMFKHAKS